MARLVSFISLASGMDERIKNIARLADSFETSYEFISSWTARGVMPPVEYINDIVSIINIIFSDLISIAKDTLKEFAESYDEDKINKLFKDSSKYLNSVEDEISKSIENGSAKSLNAAMIKLHRLFYQFVYTSLFETSIYIKNVSLLKLSQEIFKRLGMVPEEEEIKKNLPSVRSNV